MYTLQVGRQGSMGHADYVTYLLNASLATARCRDLPGVRARVRLVRADGLRFPTPGGRLWSGRLSVTALAFLAQSPDGVAEFQLDAVGLLQTPMEQGTREQGILLPAGCGEEGRRARHELVVVGARRRRRAA